MPKILIFKQIWIFIIYDTDMYENRRHVHIGRKGTVNLCKIWLEPEIEISKSGDLTKKELKTVKEITEQYHQQLIEQWDKFISGKGIQIIKVN